VVKFSTVKKERNRIGRIRGDEHSFDARIHADNAPCFLKFRDLLFIVEDQVQFFIDFFKFRVFPITRRDVRMMKRNDLTPESHTFSGFVEISFPYQRDCGIFEDGKFPSFVGLSYFICCSNLFADATGKLGRKFEFFSKDWIESLGNAVGVQFFRIENYRAEPVEGLDVIGYDREGFVGARDFDFCGSDDFHCGYPLILMQ
jgi:hypothetical protein